MSTLRALLLTDVVDSTKLTQALGDAAMADLWIAHDRAARDLLPGWRGREIDKTDGMLLLFDNAADAVGYALAYHRALAALKLPFSARAGIHVGPVNLRANSADDIARGAKPVEVDGLALPIAARVMSVALGRQTLLSTDARLALGVVPERVQSHGHWRLQGVTDPVELFEIGDANAHFAAPPDAGKAYRVVRQGELWQPVRQIKHSLPAERDSFVGRQEPLLALAKKLEDGARLVSVLGMGGTGKTRLVTRFAWSWLGEFPGGVWFCDLSQARSVDGIFFAVAQGLDVPLGKTDPVVQLAHAINGRGPCLVILDNFEQVARHAEETLGRWLDRAAQARFIVTTREVLGIVGEETMALAPLPADEARTLFIRRANAVLNRVTSNGDEPAAIAKLVQLLDGLPLAIELAAARVSVMTAPMLLERMSERFGLLAARGGRHDRQATLRGTFDWSWALLNPHEKAAFAQLSVFDGGFTLTSAQAMLDSGSVEALVWWVDVVQSLVDKCLVRRVSEDRFDMLESLREYAAEHLRTEGRFDGSGGLSAADALRRHWQYFATIDESEAVLDHCADANNLVSACRRAAAAGDTKSAAGAMAMAWAALKLCGPFSVGLQLSETVGVLPGLTASDSSLVQWVAGSAHYMLGHRADSLKCLSRGLELSRVAGDVRQEARFLCALGEQASAENGKADAPQTLAQAGALARQIGDAALQCRVLDAQGTVCYNLGRLDEADRHYRAALAIANHANDTRWRGGILGNLGNLAYGAGRIDEALQLYEQSLAVALQSGDKRWEGNMRCNVGLLHHEQGSTTAAQTEFEGALAMARQMGYARLQCTVLCNLGIVLEAQGEAAAARHRYEEAITLARDLADRRSEGQFRGYLGSLLARTGHVKAGLTCLGAGEELLIQASDQLSLGLLLCRKAEAEHLVGRSAHAAKVLKRIEAIASKTLATPDSELGKALSRLGQVLVRRA